MKNLSPLAKEAAFPRHKLGSWKLGLLSCSISSVEFDPSAPRNAKVDSLNELTVV
jgi:hypothetical protein